MGLIICTFKKTEEAKKQKKKIVKILYRRSWTKVKINYKWLVNLENPSKRRTCKSISKIIEQKYKGIVSDRFKEAWRILLIEGVSTKVENSLNLTNRKYESITKQQSDILSDKRRKSILLVNLWTKVEKNCQDQFSNIRKLS